MTDNALLNLIALSIGLDNLYSLFRRIGGIFDSDKHGAKIEKVFEKTKSKIIIRHYKGRLKTLY